MKRCAKIAQLLVEGKKGQELEEAIQEFDRTHVPEVVTRFEAPITARSYRRSSSAPIDQPETKKPFLSASPEPPRRIRSTSSQPSLPSTPSSQSEYRIRQFDRVVSEGCFEVSPSPSFTSTHPYSFSPFDNPTYPPNPTAPSYAPFRQQPILNSHINFDQVEARTPANDNGVALPLNRDDALLDLTFTRLHSHAFG